MLQEARARLVDVETGFEPRPMRSLTEEPEPPPEPAAGARTSAGGSAKLPGPKPAPAAAPRRPARPEAAPEPPPSRVPSPEPSAAPFGDDALLWLGDPSDDGEAEPGDGSQDIAPWRRGRRG